MKKRIIALLLVVVMILGLAGCKKGDTSGVGSSGEKKESWLTDEKVTLRVLTSEGTSTSNPPASNDLPFWKWLEEYTNVHIEWEVASGAGYAEVVTNRLAAGVDLPDIMMVNTLQIAENAGMNGILIDLSEYWDSHFVNTNKYWDEQGVDFESHISSYDGSIYALIGMAEPQEGHITLMYNKDWLTKLGEEVPTTLDEFTALLKKMQAAGDLNGNGEKDEVIFTSDGIGGVMSAIGPAFGLEQYEQWDAFVADENGKVSDEYTSENMKQYFKYVNQLYKDKLLDQEISSMSANRMAEKIAADRVGVFAYYSSYAITYGQLTTKGQNDPYAECFSLGMALDSQYNNNDGYFILRERALGSPTAITNECENVELACKWLDTLYADPNVLNTRIYGIEGEDWEKDEDGNIRIIYPSDGSVRNISIKGCGQIPLCHFQTKEQLLAGNEQYQWYLDEYERMRTECTWKSPTVKHIALYSEEESELLFGVNSDVKGMFGEYRDKFIKGNLNIDKDWATYVAAMNKMGLQDMVKAWQSIHDRTK